ncbi:MAG: hypothetical protein C0483_09000 [Pirellula sp.]|nr:hypothetical protein [Pirellula sp.]
MSRIAELRESLRSQGDVRVPSSTAMVHMVEFYLRVPPEDLEQYEGLKWFTAHQLAMLPPFLRRRYLPMVREQRLSGRQLREAIAADRRHRELFELSSNFKSLFTSMLATVEEAKFKSLQFARCIDKLAPDRLSHHRNNLEALDELIERFEVELLDRATTVGSAIEQARQKLLELPPVEVPDAADAAVVQPATEGVDSADGNIEQAAGI